MEVRNALPGISVCPSDLVPRRAKVSTVPVYAPKVSSTVNNSTAFPLKKTSATRYLFGDAFHCANAPGSKRKASVTAASGVKRTLCVYGEQSGRKESGGG